MAEVVLEHISKSYPGNKKSVTQKFPPCGV